MSSDLRPVAKRIFQVIAWCHFCCFCYLFELGQFRWNILFGTHFEKPYYRRFIAGGHRKICIGLLFRICLHGTEEIWKNLCIGVSYANRHRGLIKFGVSFNWLEVGTFYVDHFGCSNLLM